MLSDDRFVTLETELAYCRSLIAELQWKLDEKERMLATYENLVSDALQKLKHISEGVKDATQY